MKNNMDGISLIEMLLVIVIGTAIITAAVRYFILTSRSLHVAAAIQQVQVLTKASYEWLDAQKQDDFEGTYGGIPISMQQLVDADLIENKQKSTKDPWGGDITLEPGSDPSHVKITLADVPKKDCKNLARRLDTINNLVMPSCRNNKNKYSGEF